MYTVHTQSHAHTCTQQTHIYIATYQWTYILIYTHILTYREKFVDNVIQIGYCYGHKHSHRKATKPLQLYVSISLITNVVLYLCILMVNATDNTH